MSAGYGYIRAIVRKQQVNVMLFCLFPRAAFEKTDVFVIIMLM